MPEGGRSAFWERVWREAVARDLIPNVRDLPGEQLRLAYRGRALWSETLAPAAGARLPGLFGSAAPDRRRHEISRVAAFAWHSADACLRCLGAAAPGDELVRRAAVWLSLAATSIDESIDHLAGTPLSEVAAIAARFASALPESTAALRAPSFEHLDDAPESTPSLVPFRVCLDQFFACARELLAAAPDSEFASAVRVELLDCLHAALEAESRTGDLGFHAPPDELAEGVLRSANVLLQQMVCYLALLGRGPAPIAAREDLVAAVDNVGEVMWILDDLADCFVDLERGQWNRLWLELARRQPAVVRWLRSGSLDLLRDGERLWDSGAVAASFDDLEAAMRRQSTLGALDPAGVAALLAMCRLLCWSWLVSAAGAVGG